MAFDPRYIKGKNELAMANKEKELDFIDFCRAKFFNTDLGVTGSINKFAHNDLMIGCVKVEFESDNTEAFNKPGVHASDMSASWCAWNFTDRKSPDNFDIFIRANKDFSGFWCVSSDYITEFQSNTDNKPQYLKTSVNDKTNDNTFWRFPMLPAGQNIIFKKTKDRPAFMIQDDWQLLKRVIMKMDELKRRKDAKK